SSFLLLSFSIILPYLIVDLKLCNRTPETIAIAYDDAKWQGIYYACKNQLIDSIITTDTIADHLIHMDI
ncbi:hypothetical protein ABQD86_12315, partial [Enterococcus hirae]